MISGHVGAVKPDRRIYEILFERVGPGPEELLFIDDSPANVRAAEALGMATIHYRPGVDLERELQPPAAPCPDLGRAYASPTGTFFFFFFFFFFYCAP